MMCMMYESYGIGCADIVLLYMYTLCYGGRDPYCTGGVRRRCYINISGGRDRYGTGEGGKTGYISYIRRKGPVLHGRSAKTVLRYTYMCNFINN